MEVQKLFDLIDSGIEENIQLVLQLIKKQKEWKEAVEERYMPLIEFFGGKTLRSLKTLPQKILELTTANKSKRSYQFFLKYEFTWGYIKKATAINFNSCSIKELPSFVYDLDNLMYASLYWNRIEYLSEKIENLTELRAIHLFSNQLQTLPNNITKLNKLSTLALADNQLIALPENIGDLTQLQGLFLSNNHLKTLPESLFSLPNLTKLNIQHNYFSNAQKKEIQAALPNCEVFV